LCVVISQAYERQTHVPWSFRKIGRRLVWVMSWANFLKICGQNLLGQSPCLWEVQFCKYANRSPCNVPCNSCNGKANKKFISKFFLGQSHWLWLQYPIDEFRFRSHFPRIQMSISVLACCETCRKKLLSHAQKLEQIEQRVAGQTIKAPSPLFVVAPFPTVKSI
jgi:hypothetical protein